MSSFTLALVTSLAFATYAGRRLRKALCPRHLDTRPAILPRGDSNWSRRVMKGTRVCQGNDQGHS